MERPYVLHLFTPGKQASPFDVNMAADAGWQIIVPYAEVGAEQVAAMTQDTIFSRGPKGAARSGIFIGGRDPLLAQTMLERARAAMFKPFVVALLADPSGAFTTAAAMVAKVEAALVRAHGTGLAGRRVRVAGGTGPVGRVAGVMAAQLGAEVTLAGRDAGAAAQAARDTAAHFKVSLAGGAWADRAALAEVEVLLACAAAGVQVVPAADLAACARLAVAADINAVPPEGVAGLGAMDDSKPLAGHAGALGIGALAIGNVKYQTQQRLLVQMREAAKPVALGVAEALAMARSVVAEQAAAAPG